MKTLINQEMGASLRIVERAGEPWFVAKDICEALGIQRSGQAVERLDEDEKDAYLVRTPGGDQNTYIVSESGLYALILRSDKPAAKVFRKWVTSVVLPEIRRTGSYSGSGWEKQLAALEQEEAAARALVVEASERLSGFRRNIAERLGLQVAVPSLPSPKLPACLTNTAGMRESYLGECVAMVMKSGLAVSKYIRMRRGHILEDRKLRVYSSVEESAGGDVFILLAGRELYAAYVEAKRKRGEVEIFTRRQIMHDLGSLPAWLPGPLRSPHQHRFSIPKDPYTFAQWWVLDYSLLDPSLQAIFEPILEREIASERKRKWLCAGEIREGELVTPPPAIDRRNGRKPTKASRELSKVLPLPSLMQPLIAWMMEYLSLNEPAARQRLDRMHQSGLIETGVDRMVRLRSQPQPDLPSKPETSTPTPTVP